MFPKRFLKCEGFGDRDAFSSLLWAEVKSTCIYMKVDYCLSMV
jgi:hypothetical protein